MEPKLVLTSISEESRHININELSKSDISMDYSIGVTGTGDFSKYIDAEGLFDTNQLAVDILNGEISIVGYKNI